MSSASPEGSLTRANPPPPIELINGSVTPTAAAAATAASAALPPARYVSAAASAAYGVPAAAAKVRLGPVVSIMCYYAPSLPSRAANHRKMPVIKEIRPVSANPTCRLLPPFTASVAATTAATPNNLLADLKVVLRMNGCLFGFVKVALEVRFILVWPVRILLVPSIKHCLPGRFYQLRFPA